MLDFLNYFASSEMPQFLPLAVILVILIIIVLIFWIIALERRINRLLGSGGAKTIEESAKQQFARLSALEKFQIETVRYLRTIEMRVRRSIQASETIRFNPFKGNGEGGNQSFATSFLSENGDGVVISSLYSRDRVSVFSKPIKGFKPTFELSEEEAEALSKTGAEVKKRTE
ncbi:MAG: DUF4446 family protein [Patescibacteria group bacterium]